MTNIIGRMGTSGGFVGRMGGSTSKALEQKINDVDSRVDTIITTPAESVSAQEIIDARGGEATLGARVNGVVSQLAENAIDMQAQVDAVIANATVDSEVILARGTEATLGARLDSTDAQLADIEQDVKITATNAITNSDFETGLSGWVVAGNTVISNEQFKIGTQSVKRPSSADPLNLNIPFTNGNKIYIGLWVYTDVTAKLKVFKYATWTALITSPNTTKTNEWERISVIATATNGGVRIDPSPNANGMTYFDGFIALDLTDIFGVGNEPTASEVDKTLTSFSNQWFSGENKLYNFRDLYRIAKNAEIVDIADCTFIKKAGEINTFNKNTAIDGCLPTETGIEVNALWMASDFIPVEMWKTYTKTESATRIVYYDKNKVGISRETKKTFTVPTGAYYVRVSIEKAYSNLDAFMVVEGTKTPINYVPYTEVDKLFNVRIGKDITPPLSPWDTKKIDILGDSITQMNGWQGYVSTALDCTFYNHGIGGTRISGTATNAMWQDVRINALSTDSDLYLVMGGINDWNNHAPIGEIGTYDTNTFIGGYQVLLEKMIAKFPTKPIGIMATTYGETHQWSGWTDQTGKLNNNGNSTMDFAEASRKVAKHYGLPIIDVGGKWGINQTNILTYIPLDTDNQKVHPNILGCKRLASVVINKLRNLDYVK